jgi:hypothetical protein
VAERTDTDVLLRFAVRDTGLGLTEEQQISRAVPFFAGRQLHHTRKFEYNWAWPSPQNLAQLMAATSARRMSTARAASSGAPCAWA